MSVIATEVTCGPAARGPPGPAGEVGAWAGLVVGAAAFVGCASRGAVAVGEADVRVGGGGGGARGGGGGGGRGRGGGGGGWGRACSCPARWWGRRSSAAHRWRSASRRRWCRRPRRWPPR